MKKLMLLALLVYATSCSNPEDRATGDPDSTSFNQTGNEKNFNTGAGGPGSQAEANGNDTTFGVDSVNRTYKPGADTTRKP